MKKMFVVILLLLTIKGFSQSNLINVSPDSCKSLVSEAEKYFNTKLHLQERSDGYQNFIYSDDSGYKRITLHITGDTSKPIVEYIVIDGAKDAVKKMWDEYFKKQSNVIDEGDIYVHTKSFDALLQDESFYQHFTYNQGMSISITEHN